MDNNKMMNNNLTKIEYSSQKLHKHSILSIIYKAIGMFFSFLISPLLLKCLGDSKYGLFITILSFVSWIYYCDLGLGNGLRNKLSESLAFDDINSSKKYICISYILITIITLATFIVFTILIFRFNIARLLNFNATNENINTILIISVFIACINFVISLPNYILYALQESSNVMFFNTLGQIIYFVLLLAYIKFGDSKLLIVAMIEGGSQLIKNVIETIYVYRKYPYLTFDKNDCDFSYSKGIVTFGIQMFVIQLAALILNSSDNIIITKYLGSEEVTPYSFCYKYFGYINTIYTIIITPLLSAFTVAYAKKDITWIKKSINKNIQIYLFFVLCLILSAFIFKPFSIIWLKKELFYDKSLIILMVVYYMILMFNHIFSTFLIGIGKIKESLYGTIISTIANIVLSIVFVNKFYLGLTGVIAGTVVSLLLTIFIGPIKTNKVLKSLG